MKKFVKLLFLFSGLFIFVGAVLFGVGFLGADGKLKNLSHLTTESYYYTEKTESEIDRVTIAYESDARIHVQISDSATQISASYERLLTKSGKSAGTVTLTDDYGHLQLKETRTWKEKFRALGWYNTLTKLDVNLVLPANRSYDLAIYSNTGDVILDGDIYNLRSLTIIGDTSDVYLNNANIACSGDVRLETDTGDITIGNLTANNLSVKTDTGDINVVGTLTAENVQATCDTGDCKISGKIVANTIAIKADTGDVKTNGNALLDGKIIVIETDTGDVSVKLAGYILDYTILASVDTGKTNVHTQYGGERKLNITVDTGDIHVVFEE